MSLIYFLLGVAAALALLTSQLWTVNQLTPGRPAKTQRLWLSGMGLRLLCLALLLMFSLWQGLIPGLWTFAGLVLGRWLGLSWLYQSNFRWVKN